MFTVQDVIHLIQYYYHTSSWEGAAADVEGFRLQSIRGTSNNPLRPHLQSYSTCSTTWTFKPVPTDFILPCNHRKGSSRLMKLPTDIEKELHVPPPPLLSVHPLRPLFDACKLLIQTHARRLPLIDKDTQTDGEVVISVLTQYRVLKFIAMNVGLFVFHVSPEIHHPSIIDYVE